MQIFPTKEKICSTNMAKPQLLWDVFRTLKEKTDAEDEEITVETKTVPPRISCGCSAPWYPSIYCRHGTFIPEKNALETKIFLKDWKKVLNIKGEADCLQSVFSWREQDGPEETLFFPLQWEKAKTAKKVIEVMSSCSLLTLYRRKKKEVLEKENRRLKEENEKLRTDNKKFSLLLEELYFPGGALAREAEGHFKKLCQQ